MDYCWARLIFGGKKHRWHALDGPAAVCGTQDFESVARMETATELPRIGKLCKRCLEAIKKPWPRRA